MSEPPEPVNVTGLLSAANQLPGHARILAEDGYGQKFHVVDALAVGHNTDDPGLVLRLRAL